MKNSYRDKQVQLIREIEEKFRRGETPSTIVTPQEDYATDNQICLTSLVLLSHNLREAIYEKVINPLKELDERQYFYLPDSLHMTVQNIRTINDPPLFTKEDIHKARAVFREIVAQYSPFSVSLQGLFSLPTSLSVCGFFDESTADLIRALRKGLADAGVPDNKTYASEDVLLGNVTVSRYTTDPNEKFLQKIEELKDIDVGTLEVNTITLLTTNSVCHPEKTTIIEEFSVF